MENKKDSYKQIVKSTSLFGGVQGFNIIINIIRSKLIAVLLGPSGMGVAGLFTATISMIDGLTNFGLGTSAVKEIAIANDKDDRIEVAKVVTVFRRLVIITGFLGTIITIVFSSQLSALTFGSDKYTYWFTFISVAVLFMQLTSGQIVVLQALRKLQDLAKANMLGSICGLFISIPIYYIFKLNGIAPAIIITSFSAFLIASFFARKYRIEKVEIDSYERRKIGKSMLSMGIMLSLSSLTTLGSSYLMRIYIGRHGGVADVGLYNAGFAIIGTYVGMIFSAMGTDYFPRLSALSNNKEQTNQLINHQAEIAILILAPILCVFFVFINSVILLLYSNEFIKVNEMIRFAALGMFFKAVSWSIGYILLAKGTPRVFFVNELIANIYLLILNVIGYSLFGLEGLGISFLAGYCIHFFQIFLFSKYKYGFSFDLEFYKIFALQLILGVSCFLLVRFSNGLFTYLFGTLLIILSSLYSIWQLNKRIGLIQIFYSIKNRLIK